MVEVDSLEHYSKVWAVNNFKNYMVNNMNRFRKITAQGGLTEQERQNAENFASQNPELFSSEILQQITAGGQINDQAVIDQIRKVFKQVQEFDNKYKWAENFFKNNFKNYQFKDYLETMKSQGISNNMAAAYFQNAWDVYKTKFSSPKGFFVLFNELANNNGANLPEGINKIKVLIDKLPSTLGKVDSEEEFMKFIVTLAQNPDNPKLNEQYQNFIIGNYIRDLVMNKSDKESIAADYVDAKAMIREIGKSESQWSDVQNSMNTYYIAYHTYITNTYQKKLENFNMLIAAFESGYEGLEKDILENGLDDEKMKAIFDVMQKALRANMRREYPKITPPSAMPEDGQ